MKHYIISLKELADTFMSHYEWDDVFAENTEQAVEKYVKIGPLESGKNNYTFLVREYDYTIDKQTSKIEEFTVEVDLKVSISR